MKQHEREYFIASIRYGVCVIKYKGITLKVNNPTIEQEVESCHVYSNAYDLAYSDDVMDEDTEINTEESVPRILRGSVQDVGSGIPLPSYGSNQPNHDYFASNITLYNMNFLRRRLGDRTVVS